MAIRTGSPKPLVSITDTNTSGIQNYVFNLPQDTTNIVVRCYGGATFSGTSPTADVYVQTTEDGTNWRDCGHFKQITAAGNLNQAEFMPISTIGGGAAANAAGGWIGSVQASTLAASRISGLPILGIQNRISIVYGGTIGVNAGIKVDVYANGQDSAN